MKESILRELIREEIRKAIAERTQDEIDADKESVNAQIVAAKAKLKAAQAGVKIAQTKISMLNKKKAGVQGEKPSEETETE